MGTVFETAVYASSTTSGWYPAQDLNLDIEVFKAPSFAVRIAGYGSLGGIRTHTVLVLSQPTPAVGLRG